MASQIRILSVDDHPMILFGLAVVLSAEPDLTVVGQATDVASATAAALRTQPDLIVLPVRLGDRLAGIELCRELSATTSAKVLIYTSFTEPKDVEAAMLAGADGLVGKNASIEGLLTAIRSIHRGRRIWLPGPSPAPCAAPANSSLLTHPQLTDREREVLALMLDRLTNKQIAAQLTVEVTTVKTHVRSLLRKLDMSSRRDLF
ncbi:response regulator transcription factor [Micromonospora sp. NPDC047548]|uniref:response regulator transcription factor n=1 Tax=Micromonospora sp. NPDC047548 TaxID=3155624 RepID=UPI0033E50D79